MANDAIARLAEAVEYPEEVPGGAAFCTLQVDGGEIAVSEEAGRLRLVCRLSDDAAQLPRLAEYAAGRMLREDATLAFGQRSNVEGQRSNADGSASDFQPSTFLWQEVPANSDAATLRRFFETFCDSCDWWRARMEPGAGGADPTPFPEMAIRP